MNENKVTMSFLTAIAIILLCIISIVMLSITYYKKNTTVNQVVMKSTLHEYDYILEADGTDSVITYSVYDHNHHLIAVCKANELDHVIAEDNY